MALTLFAFWLLRALNTKHGKGMEDNGWSTRGIVR
jgi:hypothetical protein